MDIDYGVIDRKAAERKNAVEALENKLDHSRTMGEKFGEVLAWLEDLRTSQTSLDAEGKAVFPRYAQFALNELPNHINNLRYIKEQFFDTLKEEK